MDIVSCVLALVVAPVASAAEPLSGQRVVELAQAQIPEALETYRDLLSLPNDANFPDDMSLVVEWLEDAFEKRGFETQRIPTAGSPLLLASRPVPGAARTVLIYLQADGQPVEPTAWHQRDPYEPVLKEADGGGGWKQIPWARLSGDRDPDWRIFARSASDSKGPIAQFLAALDALAAAGRQTDFDMKVIVDTEEEMGSPNLPAAVETHRDLLAADMLVIFDGPPHVSGRPTLDFGARGIATVSLTVYGPRLPQHSGHYGNYLPNPAVRLAQIIASMKDDRGRVTIPGFYDGVSLDVATLQRLARVPDDEASILSRMGVAEPDAVAGSLQQAIQFPSLNVRGMRSAWVGSESRTIVPATAVAEIDVRLVLESDPERLIRLVREHIERLGYHLTSGAPTDEERKEHARIASFQSSIFYAAYRTEIDSDAGLWLRSAFEHLYGEEPILIRTSGGSIPISPFVQTLGVPAVSVGTVNPDNNQHSPNENLRLGNFEDGIATILAVLAHPLGK